MELPITLAAAEGIIREWEGGGQIVLKLLAVLALVALLPAAFPGVRVVHLDSPGGRVGEGKKLHALIRAHKLDTYVETSCQSACTLAFTAGRERILLKGATLGFHRGRLVSAKTPHARKLGDVRRQPTERHRTVVRLPVVLAFGHAFERAAASGRAPFNQSSLPLDFTSWPSE